MPAEVDEIKVFLAGSTNKRYYERGFRILTSIGASLSDEWPKRMDCTLPRMVVHSADSSMEQTVLTDYIGQCDVVIFHLDAEEEVGEILLQELDTALGLFLWHGQPYPYVFLHRGRTDAMTQSVRRALDSFSFLQYYVEFGQGDSEIYAQELIKIVLSAYIEKVHFAEDRKRAVFSHLPKVVQNAFKPNDIKDDSACIYYMADEKAIFATLYICNRLLYTRAVNVSFAEVQKKGEADGGSDSRISAGVRVTSNLGKTITVYINTGYERSQGVSGPYNKIDSPNIKVFNPANATNKAQMTDHINPIDFECYSNNPVNVSRYIKKFCEGVEKALGISEEQ